MGAAGLGFRQINGRFFQRLEAVTANSWASRIAMLFGSDQASEEYKWLGMSPAVREWIGGRNAKGFRESGVVIKNKTFESTLELDVDEIRRDKTGQIMVRVNELAERVSEHWAKLLTDLIVTPGNSYDGVGYFSSSHVEGDSGTQDNDLVAGDVAELNITTANDPTIAEMEKAIPKVIQKLFAFKDDQGEPLNSEAREFLIMVPTNLWAATAGALNLPVITDGSGARSNLVVNLAGYNFSAVVNPRLTADTVFYVFRTDASAKPFIMQEELPVQTAWDETQEFKSNKRYYGVKAIRNVGTGFWQYALKCTLS